MMIKNSDSKALLNSKAKHHRPSVQRKTLEKPYKCDKCSYRVKDKTSLKRPIEDRHRGNFVVTAVGNDSRENYVDLTLSKVTARTVSNDVETARKILIFVPKFSEPHLPTYSGIPSAANTDNSTDSHELDRDTRQHRRGPVDNPAGPRII